MSVIDKLLRWDELRVQLKAAEKIGVELAKENLDLCIENIRLKRKIEQLTKMVQNGYQVTQQPQQAQQAQQASEIGKKDGE